MPILSNPKQRRIRIAVGDAAVILVLREYTQPEFTAFMQARFETGRRGKAIDKSMPARIKFVDQLLIGIEAEDPDGREDYVAYIDPADGEERKLTPEVENWTNYVSPSWKIAAALELEAVDSRMEGDLVKN